jgi:hypothetical protein
MEHDEALRLAMESRHELPLDMCLELEGTM